MSLGYIGLYEATSVFYGKDWMRDHDWDPEGKEFALSIVKRMNELCKDWSTAEGYHYSVYSTPAESLTDRFNRMDREKFGEVDGVTDHDFYTISTPQNGSIICAFSFRYGAASSTICAPGSL